MRQIHLCLLAGLFQGKAEGTLQRTKNESLNYYVTIQKRRTSEKISFLNTTAGAVFNSIFMFQISNQNWKATLELDYCVVLFVSISIRNVNNESIITWIWCRWSVCKDGARQGNCSPLLGRTFPLTSAAPSHFLNGTVLLGKQPISCSVLSAF